MWKSLICFFTGQHAYAVTCEPGHIFLRCRGCGRQTTGWGLRQEQARDEQRVAVPVRAVRRQPHITRNRAA